MIRKLIITLVIFLPVNIYAQQQSLKYEIRYKHNKYELSATDKQTISTISDHLIGKKDYIIYINGHTDSDADSSYNQQLSLKRSLGVKNFLMSEGIDESLIKVQAKGEEQPLVENSTPLEKAKNRRVEIVVLFLQKPQAKTIEVNKITDEVACDKDTTTVLDGGYIVTMSKCDWERNRQCLSVIKSFTYYTFTNQENWLKKHLGFNNYSKTVRYSPHYEFFIAACQDSCFQNKIKLYIPQYNAQGLIMSARYSQRKNNRNQSATLKFKKINLGDSSYYVTDIYCPGILNCNTDNRCTHEVDLYAKNHISILSYSYYIRSSNSYFDSLILAKSLNPRRLTENYTHTFFHYLTIVHKSDTITLRNIPIDVFAHNKKKIKSNDKYKEAYFLFIPYRKRNKCEHFTKYKIRAKDIDNLKQFNLFDLKIEK